MSNSTTANFLLSLLSTAFRRLAYVGLFSVVFATILFDDEEDEEPVEEAKEGERQTTSEGSEGSEANEEDTIFIPLGFAYKLPRKFYKGTDPEWQSFIQLSRDKKRCEFLKSEHGNRSVQIKRLIVQQTNSPVGLANL